MELIDRSAARVLLVDDARRVLLFRGGDPARPGQRWWFTPGGGLADGESRVQAAVRELREETGLRVTARELGEPVWHQVVEFDFDGRHYRQEQEFFLCRVAAWQVDTAGFDANERRTVDEHRWWSPEELEATAELVYPAELATLLRRCTAGVRVPPGSLC